ncbi:MULTISPECIES: hypothetical protein [Haloferax]|uniref:Uncharacterized protein n=1 Tax=Haloferax marinum TaxID=2666143 RepID=A0A6A8G4Z7_9EURY|nr:MULTISPECIES: hypothetical protein [Haloferax]KAB1196665.1 hypothetical protein Hfx1150_03685 [Haloferax sp. CBA1150]MRW95672.1 hypothetical protein [Haloferax marinum]
MNVLGYVGFVSLFIVLGVGVKWFDPAAVSQISRRMGLSRTKGWSIGIVALLWMFLPVLAGAELGDNELWVAGAAVAGAGFYLATIAAGSIDEHRLLQRVPHVAPEAVSSDGPDTLVATSGVPKVPTDGNEDEFRTPFTGHPSIHTDWIVQRREQLGVRTVWRNVAEGVRSAEFTLGDGAVRVTPGQHRVFTSRHSTTAVELDGDIDERTASFLREHPELPSPGVSDGRLKVTEQYVPADEPVTVLGHVEQTREPGVVRIDGAPIDALLGTHANHSASPEGEAEAILIRGGIESARRTMHKRVYWLGTVSVGMILGGQLASFWLSSASFGALL